MKRQLRLAAFAGGFLAVPFTQAHSQDGASWLRSAVSNALNPRISVVGDFVTQAGPGQSNDVSMREVEVAVQAEVDPTTRADFFFALHNGESFELEEGYITLLSLPLGLQARAGKMLANFGRLNLVHTHELPQVDRPQALVDYLGEEGLGSTGAEVSRVFTPFGLFTELTYAFLESLGDGHHHHEEPETTTITDDNGDPQTIAIHEDEPEDPNSKLRDFAHVGRFRVFKDFSDEADVEVGVSGAHYAPTGGPNRTVAGGDLTFRWKPLQTGLYRSFIWRTEVLKSRRRLPAEFDASGALTADGATFQRTGGYSYVKFQASRRWRFGVRGDYVENAEGASLITKGVSPYVTFHSSEFNRYRLQYRYRDLPLGERDHTGYLQWTAVLGPHGAHPY